MDPVILEASALKMPAYQGPGWTSCPFGLRLCSAGVHPLQYLPPALKSTAYNEKEIPNEQEELFEEFTPGEYILKVSDREQERKENRRWRRGYFYSTYVSTRQEDKSRESDRLYKIATPPGVCPTGYDAGTKRWIMEPVDGMIEMPAGIPFVAQLRGFTADTGEDGRFLTTVCLQTLESIEELYPLESSVVREYVEEVQAITWGNRTTKPLFMMDGRKLNNRSGAPSENSADGSSSHGPTVEEEVGAGFVVPASQGSSDFALIQQMKLLTRLSALYRLIVPMCVSKLEWDVWLARAQDVNAICCGGSFGFTSLQKNVSSKRHGGVLAVLGLLAGAWHVNIDDDPAGWTLILCLLRLPPGSAVGDFMLGRAGLYARLWPDGNGNVVFFLLFKGNDIHSGTAPTTDDEAWAEFIAKITLLFSHVGPENRVVYVMYPNRHCARRDAGVSVTEDVGFGITTSTQISRKHNIAEEGSPALGLWDDLQVFLPVTFPTDLFYHDLRGNIIPVCLPFDPEADFARISELRGQYVNLDLSGSLYNLRMTKPHFATVQEASLAAAVSSVAIEPPANATPDSPVDVSASAPIAPSTDIRRSNRHGANTSSQPSSLTDAGELSKAQIVQQMQDGKSNDNGNGDGDVTDRPQKRQVAVQREVAQSEMPTSGEKEGKRYSVSMILGVRYNITRGMNEFLCRFTGYSENDDWWVLEHDLDAPKLVQDFLSKTNSDSPSYQVHCDYLTRISPYSIQSDGSTLSALGRLLDDDHLVSLSHTIANLSRRRASVSLPKQCENLLMGTQDLATSHTSWNENGSFSGDSAQLLFTNLIFAGQALDSAADVLREVEIMQSASSLSVCRSLRFIYLWRMLFGLNVANRVFDEVSKTGASLSWPKASVLMVALRELVVEEAARRPPKRNKRRKTTNNHSATSGSSVLFPVSSTGVAAQGRRKKGKGKRSAEATVASEWMVPGDLCGLIDSTSANGVPVPPPSPNTPLDDPEAQRAVACDAFVTVIFNTIIVPHLETLDLYINRSAKEAGSNRRRTPTDATSVQACTLIRGALLDSFVDWLDNDGLFASPIILEVLQSLLGMLDVKNRSETKVCNAMLGGGTEVFLALESWLRGNYDASDIQQAGWSLAELLQEALSRLANFMELHYQSISCVPTNTPLSGLCPYSDGLRVDILALIIREALNYQDKRGVGERALSNVIQAINPVVRVQTSQKNVDHYNPIRAHNSLQTMVSRSFANCDLDREPYGLSNLLVILGTGQGELTRTFFQRSLEGKFFTSAEACINTFEAAFSANPDISLNNKRCWGSACSWLGFARTGDNCRPQFKEKLEPFFSNTVVQLWNTFQTGNRKSYKEALVLSESTKLDGFRSGLTRMQLANTLALLGLCELPSCDDMADIVRTHKNKGAFEGLQRLGLNITASSMEEEV
ncbi:hypothetical protein V5O48_017005 [Marasmius crinis-equi]|uniref:Chromo domain-containing protein n=1 Tax=Marasmius crinis-equi TaxID=585013 RepID=A0ABR3EQE3_9AGAR